MSFLSLLTGGLSLFNSISSNNRANEAVDQQAAALQAEIDLRNRVMDLYQEGSDEMKTTLNDLLGSFGTYDDVSVENFNGMRDYFSDQRKLEEAVNAGKISAEEARDLQFLFNVDSDFREKSNRWINQGEGRVSDQDAIFNYNAPSTFDMAPNVDAIAQKFINARMANAERAIDTQYSKGLAGIPEGMENSTLRVQLEKNAADLRSQALNDAMLAGVNDAMSYASGVQGLTQGEQTMNLTERKFGQDLIGNAMDYATGAINNETKMGSYGLSVYDNYNDARTQAITDLGLEQGLRNNAALGDWITGLDTMAKQSGIFTDYAATSANLAASPYKFAADGGTAQSFGSALSGADKLSSSLISAASDASGAFGTWLDKFLNDDKKPIS